MATLTKQTIAPTGIAPTFVAASAGGDKVTPGGDTIIHVKNGSGGSITVTVDSTRPCSFGFDHDLVVAVPAGQERMVGPLPADRYASPTDGLVAVTYSGVTSLTVAAIAVGVS